MQRLELSYIACVIKSNIIIVVLRKSSFMRKIKITAELQLVTEDLQSEMKAMELIKNL